MLILNFGYWSTWEAYDPNNGFFGEQKVTFDGPNKLILVNDGVTELTFLNDVYSAWKEWQLDPTGVNSKYLQAISVIGGDPLPGSRQLGTTYFLENGWKMRTWNGDHTLTVNGNVFTRTGEPLFVDTTEPVTTRIVLNTSTLVETIVPETSLSNTDFSSIADAVWDEALSDHLATGSTGKKLDETSNVTITVPSANDIADAVWNENLATYANNTAGFDVKKLREEITRILALEEADEEYTAGGIIKKKDKDTKVDLLIKTITGIDVANTVTLTDQ